MKRSWMVVLAMVFVLGLAGNAAALNYSFYGTFTQDDDVQLFTFTVETASEVTLRTWSYAGGVNAEGVTVERGGFDPILALFDGDGLFINQNDDGDGVPYDLSGVAYDTLLTVWLEAGTYTVAVMQYDNFANGPYLSDGFSEDGQGNFTGGFVDVSGSEQYSQRDSHWAFDILNVGEAEEVPSVPIPAAVWLLGSGLVGLAGLRKKLLG